MQSLFVQTILHRFRSCFSIDGIATRVSTYNAIECSYRYTTDTIDSTTVWTPLFYRSWQLLRGSQQRLMHTPLTALHNVVFLSRTQTCSTLFGEKLSIWVNLQICSCKYACVNVKKLYPAKMYLTFRNTACLWDR